MSASAAADASPAGSTSPLGALLTASRVETRVRVDSWQEAVDRVGRLLVRSRAVEPRYVEAMKRVLMEMGPYAVVAPGIVLLHARPEDGVRRPCLALVTLARPVAFGHSQNDPVDLVFALGAVDKQAHLSALQQLARLLADSRFVQHIRSATDKRQVLAAVRTWDGASPRRGHG